MPESVGISTQDLFGRYHEPFRRYFLSYRGNEKALPRIEREFRAALGIPTGIPHLDDRKRAVLTGDQFLDEAGSQWRAFLEGRLKPEGPVREARSLYALWRLYRETFTIALRALFTHTSSVLDQQVAGLQFSSETPVTIFKVSQNAEETAKQYLQVIARMLQTVPRDTVEHALVKAQLAALARVRTTAVQMNRAMALYLKSPHDNAKGLNADQLELLKSIGIFENEWGYLANPLGWAHRLSEIFLKSDVMVRSGFSVYVPQQAVPQLEHANPQLLLEVMDRLFMVAAINGIPLQFSWNGGELAITSPKPMNNIYDDGVTHALAEELGGRWEKEGPSLVGRLRKKLRGWMPPVRGLLFPLQVTNMATTIINMGNAGAPPAAIENGGRQTHGPLTAGRHGATNGRRRAGTAHGRGNCRMVFRPTVAMRAVRG